MKETGQGLKRGLRRDGPAAFCSAGQAADEASPPSAAEARYATGTVEKLRRDPQRGARPFARESVPYDGHPAAQEGWRRVFALSLRVERIEARLRADAEAAARAADRLMEVSCALTRPAEALLVRERYPAGIFGAGVAFDDDVERRLARSSQEAFEAVAHACNTLAVGRADDESRLASLQPRRPQFTCMTAQPIRSAQNHRVKGIRRLRARQGAALAAKEELLLLEGRHLVEAALDAGLELAEALATVEFAERHASLLERLPPGALHWVEPSLLAASADSDAPQGLVAIARKTQPTVDECPQDGLVVYLDGVQDPGNLGAIARSAEAFGASALVVSPGSSHWRHPRALRGSAGSLLRLPCFPGVTPEALDEALSRHAPWWVLTKEGDCCLEDVAQSSPAVLVLGSESHGPRGVLAAEALAPRRRQVSIPIASTVESLNVAVAGSIALHVLRRT